jgi:CDP-glucose 4,6-dehydratase
MLAEQLAANPRLRGSAFNFSHEQPLTVLALIDKICRLMGVAIGPQILNEACHEIREQCLSAEKARSELGWCPLFDMDSGLRKTIDWYRKLFQTPTARSA